jgi:hypothetical protein
MPATIALGRLQQAAYFGAQQVDFMNLRTVHVIWRESIFRV